MTERNHGQGFIVREGDFLRGKKAAEIAVYSTEAPDFEARLAAALIERWGIVASEVDGEDSAGRARLRRMKTDELVAIACDTAEAAAAEFRKRDWMLSLPSLPEAAEILKARQDANS